MSRVNVSWAKTKDDPNLPKGWSKHTTIEDKPQKKIKQDTKEP